jgi:hypothetical protein
VKISEAIKQLETILQEHGDINAYLEDSASTQEIATIAAQQPGVDVRNMVNTIAYENFFIVPEQHTPEDGGWCVNIRSWPY